MKLNHPIKKLKLSLRAIKKIKNWKDYFLDYLGLKNGKIIYEINNKKIITRAKTIDKSIFTEVVLGELYFPEGLIFKENPIIVDVGAHIGLFSLTANSKTENSKIYSIEPNSKNYNILLEQIEINDLNGKIIPFKIALSDKDGKMRLYSGEHSARGSLTRKEGGNFEDVITTTLENFFKKNNIESCDLMKMDIEGGEYSVLYATPKKIFDKIQRIFLELHNIEGENKQKMLDFLKKMGFILKYKSDDFIQCFNSNLSENQ